MDKKVTWNFPALRGSAHDALLQTASNDAKVIMTNKYA